MIGAIIDFLETGNFQKKIYKTGFFLLSTREFQVARL